MDSDQTKSLTLSNASTGTTHYYVEDDVNDVTDDDATIVARHQDSATNIIDFGDKSAQVAVSRTNSTLDATKYQSVITQAKADSSGTIPPSEERRLFANDSPHVAQQLTSKDASTSSEMRLLSGTVPSRHPSSIPMISQPFNASPQSSSRSGSHTIRNNGSGRSDLDQALRSLPSDVMKEEKKTTIAPHLSHLLDPITVGMYVFSKRNSVVLDSPYNSIRAFKGHHLHHSNMIACVNVLQANASRSFVAYSKEVDDLLDIDHEHVARCLHLMFIGTSDDRMHCSVHEYFPLSLPDYNDQHPRPMPSHTAYKLCSDMTGALDYLASINMCHRDIKPHNIKVHISDDQELPQFKLCNFVFASDADNWHQRTMQTGDFYCLAPEQFLPGVVPTSQRLEQLKKQDVWALAATLFSAISGRQHIMDIQEGASDYNMLEVLIGISEWQLEPFLDVLPRHMPVDDPGFVAIFSSGMSIALLRDPVARCSATQLKEILYMHAARKESLNFVD